MRISDWSSDVCSSDLDKGEHPLHVCHGNMTFEDHAVDESGMTGGKRRRNAASALKGRSVLIVDHPDGPVELRPHLGGPLLAAAAAWVAMHHDRSCRAGRQIGRAHV